MSEQINPMIHKYCQNGTYMLLDVNSGIINVIDKVTYDILDIYDGTNKNAVYEGLGTTYSRSELDESLSELDELIETDIVFQFIPVMFDRFRSSFPDLRIRPFLPGSHMEVFLDRHEQ